MRLVADSVAQMRQAANTSLITHPLNLALLVGVLSLVARYMYDQRHDIGIVGTTCAGMVMVSLALCRYATHGYILAAEDIDWNWLDAADVIVTKFGDEMIGTVIIDWVSGESRQRRKKAWRGEIKGWTVRLKYRQKGVGAALLEDAVKESRKKGAETIEFAEVHASKWSASNSAKQQSDLATQIRSAYFLTCTTASSTSEKRGQGSCCKTCSKPVRASQGGREEVAREMLLIA